MEKDFLSIPLNKKKLSKKILIESNKILIPITQGKKLIDYVHTSDFFKEQSETKKKNFSYRRIRVYWICFSKEFIRKKIKS